MNNSISSRSLSVIAIVCVLCAGAIARAGEETNATVSITLRECVERALQSNLAIQLERLNPTIATWGVVFQQSSYDPTLSGSVDYEDSLSAPFSSSTNSTGASRTLRLQPSLGLSGKFASGATYGLSANPSGSGPSLSSNFVYSGSTVLQATQPLLKDFGFGVNAASIRIARKNHDIAVQNFILQVITTVTDVKNAYYELIFAIEDYKAKLEDVNLAKELLDQTRRRLQIGVMSPLDVTQAESGVASREQAVILAERSIKDNENALKRLISQDVGEFHNQTLVPANYPVLEMVTTDVAQSIRTALERRPDYVAARQSVEKQNIQLKFDRNQLWPSIDLKGSYGWNGTGGGLGNWAGDIGSGDFPVWAVGVTVSFPLGNRQARANYQTSRLAVEQSLLQLKQLEQQIIVDVDNAAGRVQTNLKSVDAAVAASRLADESLKAEQTKLRAGTSTTFLVLQAQSQLAAARSAEIRARADYSKSLVALDQAEGTTLQKDNITLDEKY